MQNKQDWMPPQGFAKQVDFVEAFNKSVGEKVLTTQYVNKQVRGRIQISKGWEAAYRLFLKLQNQ